MLWNSVMILEILFYFIVYFIYFTCSLSWLYLFHYIFLLPLTYIACMCIFLKFPLFGPSVLIQMDSVSRQPE